jgi:hypothetical protein
METMISNRLAYLTIFKLLPWEEQKAVYEMISDIFEFEQIRTNGKIYDLLFPLRCILEEEGNYFIVRNDMLDLVGTGLTEIEAKESFFMEFDFAYMRYNELADEKLSDRLLKIKRILNFIVK